MEQPPVQYPWEIKPQTYGPYQQRKINARSSVPEGSANQPAKPYYNRGKTSQRMTISQTSAAMRYKQGLSSAVKNNTNWFRKVKPGPVLKSQLNLKPLMKQGKVIKGSKSTALAGRGAVSLAVMKHGGGGSGAFSK